MIKSIVLFDIDGVMVNPRGYRESVKATLKYFFRKMDLINNLPGDDIPALFESVGITSEWDMIPICLAIAIDTVLEKVKDNNVFLTDFDQTFEYIKNIKKSNLEIDYATYINGISNQILNGNVPPGTLLSDIVHGKFANPFNYLSKHPIFSELFLNTRDIHKSLTLQVFQNYVLGNDLFKEVYNKEPVINSSSYLRNYDIPKLNPENNRKICKLLEEGIMNFAIYTARPSLAPREVEDCGYGYSPEAEIAVELNKLIGLPLIGLGKVSYIAQENGINPEELIKPSPYQALAGIFAALTKNELFALELAFDLLYKKENAKILDLFKSSNVDQDGMIIDLHIFEDSMSGIQAGKEASDVLLSVGVKTNFHAWGISQDLIKSNVLKNNGISVYKDINAALETFNIHQK